MNTQLSHGHPAQESRSSVEQENKLLVMEIFIWGPMVPRIGDALDRYTVLAALSLSQCLTVSQASRTSR